MRKSTAALSALALSALALTGCTAAPGSAAVCDRDDSAALERSLNVTGGFGAPNVRLDSPVTVGAAAYDDLIVGEGPVVTDASQNLIMTRVVLDGATGQELGSGVSVWSPEAAAEQIPGSEEALQCATEGSRVAVAVPASDLPEGLASQIGMDASSSLIAVYDIQYAALTRAQGADVFNDARGLPTVVRAADGRPGIIIPDGEAPAETSVQTLIRGEGEKVGDGRAMLHYTGVKWSTRNVTSTSWDGAVVFQPDPLPEQVMDAVADATVGSQLLVVIPDESGDADTYVVDVLGIVPAELISG